MTRAAIYARYSSELQSDQSIDDQVSLCREFAARQGLEVVAVYSDHAVSGAAIVNRPGLMSLIAAARAGEFDMLIADSTSRIARDQEARAYLRKRLRFLGIAFATVADGVVSDLVDGVRSVIDAAQLDDLRHMVRRGQRGRILEGKAAGGLCYGYRAVKGEPGRREIDEAQAAIVRRVYAEFIAGANARDIARGLNRDGIPAPRGGLWLASTINGSGKRGNGILRNPVYAGMLAWNRVTMVKDPDNPAQRRLSRPNAREQWVTADAPQLAIVSRADYEAAQRLIAARAQMQPCRRRTPKRLLSGLLRCAGCGGGLSASGRDKSGRTRLRCSRAKEGGRCPAPATFYLDEVERLVVGALRRELARPDAIAAFVRGYTEERRRRTAAAARSRAAVERRIGALSREIDRLVDCIAKGQGDPAVLGPRSTELHRERERLRAELAAAPPEPIALHPGALAHYERAMARLAEALSETVSAGDAEAIAALRELIESVTVSRPAGAAEGVAVEITGRLGALVGAPAFPHCLKSASCRSAVAGEGLEPPTSGL
jgi:site-specific DNA recombinase